MNQNGYNNPQNKWNGYSDYAKSTLTSLINSGTTLFNLGLNKGTALFNSGLNKMKTTLGYQYQGGRRRTRRRKHKGGNFRSHTQSNGLAANASHISGIQTASFKTVGGKRRRSKCKKHHPHTSKCRR